MTGAWSAAVHAGDLETLARLADTGADLNARDGHGQTALMIAAHQGRAEVVTFLVARGASLDDTAKYGLSALMLAVVAGHHEIVRLLAAAGADRTLRGSGAPGFADKTALDLARARGATDLERVLR